ncbi:MAG: DUF4168 domain-containing protein [Sphingobium phenoxybenzoativorans]
MNRISKLMIMSILPLSAAGTAFAQAAAPAEPAAPGQAAPAPAAPAGAATFSDEEIQKFAAAAVELNKIQSDATVTAEQKQPKMLAAVQATGLDPQKFNAIGQAAQSDPALQQKIQAAASASSAAAPAPAAPPKQ